MRDDMTKQEMADYTREGGQIPASMLTAREAEAMQELATEKLVRFDGYYWLAPKRVRQTARWLRQRKSNPFPAVLSAMGESAITGAGVGGGLVIGQTLMSNVLRKLQGPPKETKVKNPYVSGIEGMNPVGPEARAGIKASEVAYTRGWSHDSTLQRVLQSTSVEELQRAQDHYAAAYEREALKLRDMMWNQPDSRIKERSPSAQLVLTQQAYRAYRAVFGARVAAKNGVPIMQRAPADFRLPPAPSWKELITYAGHELPPQPSRNPYTTEHYRHEDIASWPRIKREHPSAVVRSVEQAGHVVRIAYWGRRRDGTYAHYATIGVLHPRREKNPDGCPIQVLGESR